MASDGDCGSFSHSASRMPDLSQTFRRQGWTRLKVRLRSLAAPTLRVWVPFVFLGAAAVPIAWILSVVGPYSHWGPPVLEFIVGVSGAGILTAGAVSGLLLMRLRRTRSPGV